MTLLSKIGMCAGFGLLCVACNTTRTLSPREAFLKAMGSERAKYCQVYEVSIESLSEREDEVLKATQIAARGVRDSIAQSPDECSAIQQRVDAIEQFAEALHRGRLEVIYRLRTVYNPKTDTILFYDLRSLTNRELAWVVMSGPRIKHKIVFAEGIILPHNK
jgi:hypothetical protein